MTAGLDTDPDLLDLLGQTGLGRPETAVPLTHEGRNAAWCGITSTGARIFAKRVAGRAAVERSVRFEQLAPARPLTPPLLAHADDLLVFALVDAENANGLAGDDGLETAHAERMGAAVAELHRLGSGTPEAPLLPTSADLRRLPLASFVAASAGELAFWSLVQPDTEMHAAVDVLRRHPAGVPARPIHGDLRLDQFLVGGDQVWLTDWEEFRFGDPARDIGAFVGDWVLRAALAVSNGVDELGHDRFLERFTGEMDRVRPFLHAFRAGYRQVREWDEHQCVRAAAYAGWHMFERLNATAAASVFLTALHRAAAGIGRAALLRPERFLTVLGLR
ncbi:class V lanthionine synthetase subunit LxmK [Actinokineospora sp. UTMC 2448]|uniref:class V lanthionine synthetase subunit LxmK n=1 Tax=Actinokineospora sp. UTMC 2448 TaxID=2268449 RepID=UPI0021643D9A|nr:class V lanthionine synthetase subunit LxmK [Actinokineospora sp. UTMC 2448]UVS81379.1 protein involved in trehalose biosynthesis [Actinokineospora sp. UTMC 2448]